MPEHTLRAIAKRSYVRFPSHWKAPKYRLGQLVDKGQIIGVEYHLPRATRSSQLSEGWHYTVLLDDQGYGVEILKESDIEPAQLEKINTKIDELNALTAHLSKQLEEAEKF